MKKIILLVASIAFLISPALAQEINGDWTGTLKVGAAELRVALHITRNSDGSLNASFDSIDQNALGIPASLITVADSNLTIVFDAIQSRYEGVYDPAANAIEGTWKQGGQSIPLSFSPKVDPPEVQSGFKSPPDIDGTWMGTLDPGTIKLRIVFHITSTEKGITATLDSPDQNARGIPVTSANYSNATLSIEIKPLGAAFTGTANRERTEIRGTFTQAGADFPLVLNRVDDASILERRRPQNPTKPYPYIEEEVAYKNRSAGIQLGGTLTIPSGSGPFPAVVLISGSGAQDRDESIMGHKPFLVLADYLTRNGIVVLRADDRGVGKSGGNPVTATSADFATDAEAGVAFLKTRPEVNADRIGLIGHSEGGLIAPMIASRNEDVAFIVLMAGTGVPGDKILEEQARLILEATGVRGEDLEKAVAIQRESLYLIKNENDTAKLEQALREKLAGQMPEGMLKSQLNNINTAWFRYFLEYDPAVELRKVKCPVLAINGEKDLQVSPKQNLPAIRDALEAGGNDRFEIIEFLGLNHLFQTAETGHPNEYGDIEETIAPVVLETISSWILKQ